MKRMTIIELYLPGYLKEQSDSQTMRFWLGLEKQYAHSWDLKRLFGPMVESYVVTGFEYDFGAWQTHNEHLFIGELTHESFMRQAGDLQLALVKAIVACDAVMASFAEAMEAKYQSTGAHPVCALSTWQQAVSTGKTRLGYWMWVCEEVERLNKPAAEINAAIIIARAERGKAS